MTISWNDFWYFFLKYFLTVRWLPLLVEVWSWTGQGFVCLTVMLPRCFSICWKVSRLRSKWMLKASSDVTKQSWLFYLYYKIVSVYVGCTCINGDWLLYGIKAILYVYLTSNPGTRLIPDTFQMLHRSHQILSRYCTDHTRYSLSLYKPTSCETVCHPFFKESPNVNITHRRTSRKRRVLCQRHLSFQVVELNRSSLRDMSIQLFCLVL